jgi:hypothetical protein
MISGAKIPCFVPEESSEYDLKYHNNSIKISEKTHLPNKVPVKNKSKRKQRVPHKL